MKRVIK